MEKVDLEKGSKETRYVDAEGLPIDPSNVYFRRDGVPYLLLHDQEGKPVMTRVPLQEMGDAVEE